MMCVTGLLTRVIVNYFDGCYKLSSDKGAVTTGSVIGPMEEPKAAWKHDAKVTLSKSDFGSGSSWDDVEIVLSADAYVKDITFSVNGEGVNIGDKFVNVEIVYTVTTTSTDIASLVVTATNEA